MFLAVLGFLDILVGAFILAGMAGNIALLFGILWFFKGLWSILSSFSAGWIFDAPGFVDIIAGLFLVFLFFGVGLSIAFWFAVVIVIKGIYSILMAYAL